jgi:autotransporter adhesin
MYTHLSIAPATLRAAGAALCSVLVICLAPAPALAQFVCQSTGGGAEGAVATGLATVVCGSNAGQGAGAFSEFNSAFGDSAGRNVDGIDNSAFGSSTGVVVNGSRNSAFGSGAGANVTGSDNTAIGDGAARQVSGNNNTATGSRAGGTVTGSGNAAFGADAGRFLTGDNNVAIGAGAGRGSASSDQLFVSNTVAIGNTATARAGGGVAIGNQSQTNGADAVAIGNTSQATGSNAVAIGASANAGHENSAAFGNGATTMRANQQVFGTASNTYTLSGVASSASRAAQSGPVQVVTSDSGGNLATASLSELGLASIGDINAINARLNDLTKESRRGIAATAALAVAMTPSAPGKTTVSVNTGFFKGETGMGVALAHRLNFATPFILHGSYANAGGNGHVGRVGFGFEF